MESIETLAGKFVVGTAFDKLADFLPELGVEKVPVQHGGVDVLDGQLTIWWPREDNVGGWVNDKRPDEHMDYTVIFESNHDPIKNRAHMDGILSSRPHLRLVFFREQSWNKRLMKFSGKSWLRYYGLYKLDVAESRRTEKLVWKKIDSMDELGLAA